MRIGKLVCISLAIVALMVALAWKLLVPYAIEREVRARLDKAGFARASFEVGKVALDRVELLDVTLARGLELGDVEIGAGPWQLWRGARADVVLHGPHIASIGAVAIPSGGGGTLPFRQIRIEDGEVDAGVDRLAVRGTIDLRARVPALDLATYAPAIHVGDTVVEGVAATIRGPANDLRACGTGTVERARLDACVQLDAIAHDAADLVWSAHDLDDRWSANGNGHLTYAHDSVALDSGRVQASVTALTVRGITIEGAAIRADVSGDLAARTFSLRGELEAEKLSNQTVALKRVRLPLELIGTADHAVKLRSDRELALTATSATVTRGGTTLRIESPLVVANGTTKLGKRVELAAGPGERGFAIVAKVRGVSIDRLLAVTTRNRVRATGVLDGELVFDLDAGDFSLVGGQLVARGPGRLLAADIGSYAKLDKSSFAVHRRVAAALADFNYTRLALSIDDDPDLHLSLEGQGRRVAQQLDIDVNVRGLLARNEGTR